MCGIAGVIAWSDRHRAGREVGERLLARLAHRGPDGQGIHLNHEGEATPDRPQAMLAHTRLAILDLDPRSNQPLSDGMGNWIVFNGEIYNYREVREELRSADPGYHWRTEGDGEVLLRAYMVWKEKCLERLNGMFAFGVWSEKEGSLFLARDRMGQKPLYCAHDPAGGFAFASGPGVLLELPWVDREINAFVLIEYLSWGYTPLEFGTIYGGIWQVQPGTWVTLKAGKTEGQVYFNPNAGARETQRDLPLLAQRTRELVSSAVRKQLVSDVPVGCFLSGGVDSSIMAAAMKASVPKDQRVLTFSIGFDDPRYDETAYAAEVARHLGTEHREFKVRPDAAEDLPKIAAAFAEPFGDSSALPTHYLARETRKHVKVALSGDGGDELFGGYDRYRAIRLAKIGSGIDRILLRCAVAIFGGWSTHPKSFSVKLKRIAELMKHAERGSPAMPYNNLVKLFDKETLRALVLPAIQIFYQAENWVFLQYDKKRENPAEAAMAVDRITYLPGDLLAKVDRCSMMHALEVRSPFMDHDLVHFAAGLPSSVLFDRRPKRLLRLAFERDLPRSVFSRKKMGFAVPIGEWFRGELRNMLHDSLFSANSFASHYFNKSAVQRLIDEHHTRQRDHSERLYALLMLELWWKNQSDATTPPHA